MVAILGRFYQKECVHPGVVIIRSSRANIFNYCIMLFCLSRKRRGHSRAHDDVNEEFIGLFKPILGRGKPTHARMEKFSKNLLLLRDNQAELRAASGIRQKKDNDEKGSPADEVEICIAYFKEIKVLDNTARKVDSFFKLSERKMPEKDRKKNINTPSGLAQLNRVLIFHKFRTLKQYLLCT